MKRKSNCQSVFITKPNYQFNWVHPNIVNWLRHIYMYISMHYILVISAILIARRHLLVKYLKFDATWLDAWMPFLTMYIASIYNVYAINSFFFRFRCPSSFVFRLPRCNCHWIRPLHAFLKLLRSPRPQPRSRARLSPHPHSQSRCRSRSRPDCSSFGIRFLCSFN